MLCKRRKKKKDNMRWFTADTHFFHQNIIKYDSRPYKDIGEMGECIIRNWNMCVSKRDIVYHLGDFAFGNPKRWLPIIKQLQGTINLIRGNHDLTNGATLKRLVVDGFPMFNDVGDLDFVRIGEKQIMLSHYPYAGLDNRLMEYHPHDDGRWLIHGHTHATTPRIRGRMINVGCMLWNYCPVSEVQILQMIKEGE